MKLIIDIPENVYKYLKQEWVKVPEDDSVINQIMHGILHGTPYEEPTQGDLISRETLKRLIEDKIDHIPADDYDEGWNGALYTTIDLIGNAPTVRPDMTYVLAYDSQRAVVRLEDNHLGWVDSNNQLPEYTGLYLVSIDDLVTVANFDGTVFRATGTSAAIEVDAWQKLPKSLKNI